MHILSKIEIDLVVDSIFFGIGVYNPRRVFIINHDNCFFFKREGENGRARPSQCE